MPGSWDGKTRPASETYRSNYNDIFGQKENKEEERKMLIRLMFEPKPGVVCNVNEMFRCYAENYLSDYPEFEWGGYIVMDVKEMRYNNSASGEPLYQFVASNVKDTLLMQIKDYTDTNPMYGYHTHIHYSVNGANEQAVGSTGTPYTLGEGI
jgi:hypothetical protein